jgi:hypothetical protein
MHGDHEGITEPKPKTSMITHFWHPSPSSVIPKKQGITRGSRKRITDRILNDYAFLGPLSELRDPFVRWGSRGDHEKDHGKTGSKLTKSFTNSKNLPSRDPLIPCLEGGSGNMAALGY